MKWISIEINEKRKLCVDEGNIIEREMVLSKSKDEHQSSIHKKQWKLMQFYAIYGNCPGLNMSCSSHDTLKLLFGAAYLSAWVSLLDLIDKFMMRFFGFIVTNVCKLKEIAHFFTASIIESVCFVFFYRFLL